MHVIVGITGGIAAYKATGIIRLLTEAGHTVKVVPTQNALRFIGATTLEALSHNAVDPDLYTDVDSVKHVALGQEADLVIVAPASASFIARYASGIADDLLGSTLLVTKAPVVIAPAMHTEMWLHPATQENIECLRSRSVKVIEPASGRLTGSDSGVGRLPEPEEIVRAALDMVSHQDLAGTRILITAGGTREEIDPVRFIGNRSSGKQGIALALEAKRRGAQVKLIAANVAQIPTELTDVLLVRTTQELQSSIEEFVTETDVLIMAAAVSDFRVSEPAIQKIKKAKTGDTLELKLVANPDILASTVARIKSEHLPVTTIGFAAETTNSAQQLEDLAKLKLATKGCDVIVANNVSNGAVFDSESNNVLIVTNSGRVVGNQGSKQLIANEILDVLVDLRSK